ncbi:MAG: type I-C CRISPR-associated protein Cas8c/Csd1 [Deltaproteobacteria bacterium]|nr:type I-C CRISPR-associated protein Cas8c/Csd1 [Deltaproteobacteria bacterium]
MILQALNQYYERLLDDDSIDIAPPGFGEAKISFELLLSPQGELKQVQDLRHGEKKPQSVALLVPKPLDRSGTGVNPNFLWDNTGYVLGVDNKDNPERSLKMFAAFKALAHELGDGLDDQGMRAVLAFLDAWQPEKAAEVISGFFDWEEFCGANVVFRLELTKGYVHDSPAVQHAWLDHWQDQEDLPRGQCLISGDEQPIVSTHPQIKGVMGAQPSGATLVSFNEPAFESYGKKQNLNSPIGALAAFAYTTALNRLLDRAGGRTVQIGDAATVFWSKKATTLEDNMSALFEGGFDLGDDAQAEDLEHNQQLKAFLESLRLGTPADSPDAAVPFYILGLSPNSSRLSVRFWHVSNVGQMEKRLGGHLRDIDMVRIYNSDPKDPPLWMLLKETANQRKTKNVAPQLAGEMTRAVLIGGAYPQSILSAVIGRIRADQTVNYLRAALIKAVLNRRRRLNPALQSNPQLMEVTVSLDQSCTDIAYLSGRLFAVLENMQTTAINNANATIRQRYLSSASSAPKATFPQLMRLSQAHFKKIGGEQPKLAGWFDKQVREIVDMIDSTGWPATLNLEQQGQFFLGYYHQKAFKPSKDAVSEEN